MHILILFQFQVILNNTLAIGNNSLICPTLLRQRLILNYWSASDVALITHVGSIENGNHSTPHAHKRMWNANDART